MVNVVMLGFGFMFLFTSFQTTGNIQVSAQGHARAIDIVNARRIYLKFRAVNWSLHMWPSCVHMAIEIGLDGNLTHFAKRPFDMARLWCCDSISTNHIFVVVSNNQIESLSEYIYNDEW